MSVGLVVVTFNRPEYLEKTLKSAARHLGDVVDDVIVVNDGSASKYRGSYKRAYKALDRWPEGVAGVLELPENHGVAYAKNAGLHYLLSNEANEWLFVVEDDILAKSPEAITGYIAACEKSGLSHLSFAHHGPANSGGCVEADDVITYYPHSIGAWCIYSRECLESVGLFDENMYNAFEHVELSMRLARAGFTSGAHRFADATGSQNWLAEIKDSIDHSSIRPLPNWQINIRDSLRYWSDNKPETYDELFGESRSLHEYAQRILSS